MSHQDGLRNNRTETTGFTEPDDGDDRVQKESDNVAHARMVSNRRSFEIRDLWGIRLPQVIGTVLGKALRGIRIFLDDDSEPGVYPTIRFEIELDAEVEQACELDDQIHIDGMALLISDDFRINVKVTHQRCVRSTHHLKIHPAEPNSDQFRFDVTPPHVVFRERRLQCFGREEPPVYPRIRRGLEPLGEIPS